MQCQKALYNRTEKIMPPEFTRLTGDEKEDEINCRNIVNYLERIFEHHFIIIDQIPLALQPPLVGVMENVNTLKIFEDPMVFFRQELGWYRLQEYYDLSLFPS